MKTKQVAFITSLEERKMVWGVSELLARFTGHQDGSSSLSSSGGTERRQAAAKNPREYRAHQAHRKTDHGIIVRLDPAQNSYVAEGHLPSCSGDDNQRLLQYLLQHLNSPNNRKRPDPYAHMAFICENVLGLDASVRDGQMDLIVKNPKNLGQTVKHLQLVERAIKTGTNLRLLFQPIVHYNDKKIILSRYGANLQMPDVSYEMLARIADPEQGNAFLSPAIFIPLVKQAGYTQAFDRRILTTAFGTCAQYATRGIRYPFSVNMSPSSILANGFPEHLSKMFEGCPEAKGRLNIEFLEDEQLDVHAREMDIHNRCVELTHMGVGLFVDDAFSGEAQHSQLELIRVMSTAISSERNIRAGQRTIREKLMGQTLPQAPLPLLTVKIDRSRVRGFLETGAEDQLPFLGKLIETARSVCPYAKFVAEGIEGPRAPELLQTLSNMGVHSFQGFFYGQPTLAPKIFTPEGDADSLRPPAAGATKPLVIAKGWNSSRRYDAAVPAA